MEQDLWKENYFFYFYIFYIFLFFYFYGKRTIFASLFNSKCSSHTAQVAEGKGVDRENEESFTVGKTRFETA